MPSKIAHQAYIAASRYRYSIASLNTNIYTRRSVTASRCLSTIFKHSRKKATSQQTNRHQSLPNKDHHYHQKLGYGRLRLHALDSRRRSKRRLKKMPSKGQTDPRGETAAQARIQSTDDCRNSPRVSLSSLGHDWRRETRPKKMTTRDIEQKKGSSETVNFLHYLYVDLLKCFRCSSAWPPSPRRELKTEARDRDSRHRPRPALASQLHVQN